jgi:hypothetical protein
MYSIPNMNDRQCEHTGLGLGLYESGDFFSKTRLTFVGGHVK